MDRLELIKILDIAKPALASKEFIPIFTFFCFDEKTVFAYNDIVSIQIPFESPIQGAVVGERLIALLKTHHSKSVEFKHKKGGEELSVKIGSTWLQLPFLPPKDFLFKFPEVKSNFNIALNDSFIEGLKRTLISAGVDTSRSNAMGVSLVIGDEIILYSTDNQTMTEYFVDMERGDKGNACELMMPREFCSILISLYDKMEKDDEAILCIEDKHLIAKMGRSQVYANLVPHDPLDFSGVISRFMDGVKKKSFIDIPKGFEGALERSVLLLDPSQRNLCNINIEDQRLTIETSSRLGKGKDPFKLKEKPGDISVLVDPRSVSRVLGYAENMCFKNTCIILRGGDNYLHLISTQPE